MERIGKRPRSFQQRWGCTVPGYPPSFGRIGGPVMSEGRVRKVQVRQRSISCALAIVTLAIGVCLFPCDGRAAGPARSARSLEVGALLASSDALSDAAMAQQSGTGLRPPGRRSQRADRRPASAAMGRTENSTDGAHYEWNDDRRCRPLRCVTTSACRTRRTDSWCLWPGALYLPFPRERS